MVPAKESRKEGDGLQLQYGLDERLPPIRTALFGLQWLAIALPGILVIGGVVGVLQFEDALSQVLYLQKLCLLVGLTIFFQVIWGHALPLVAGPAAVLLVGVVASQGFPWPTIYTSMMVGGAILLLLGVSGWLKPLQRLFTARIVAVVLLLIAFTLLPTILRLILPPGMETEAPSRLLFATVLLLLLSLADRVLSGIWQSTLIVWGLLGGSLAWLFLFGSAPQAGGLPGIAGPFRNLITDPQVHPGVIASFLVCYLALSVNDLGSIQSMNEMLGVPDASGRFSRGISLTGAANVLSGFLGVIGPVNFSLSPGVVAATGCASRFPLLPASLLLVAVSFSPAALGFIGRIPTVVTGVILLHILGVQVAAGLRIALRSAEAFTLRDGTAIGLPVLLGTLTAMFPVDVVRSFPAILRPVLGNGFAVGVVAALLLEGVRRKS